jgi:hypothetical protein
MQPINTINPTTLPSIFYRTRCINLARRCPLAKIMEATPVDLATRLLCWLSSPRCASVLLAVLMHRSALSASLRQELN